MQGAFDVSLLNKTLQSSAIDKECKQTACLTPTAHVLSRSSLVNRVLQVLIVTLLCILLLPQITIGFVACFFLTVLSVHCRYVWFSHACLACIASSYGDLHTVPLALYIIAPIFILVRLMARPSDILKIFSVCVFITWTCIKVWVVAEGGQNTAEFVCDVLWCVCVAVFVSVYSAVENSVT